MRTFVMIMICVFCLGAMQIFTAPANHYWEDTGIIGNHFQETLNLEVYAWDIWMIFAPGVEWEG